jgi:DNA mismatch repair protein MutS
LATKAPKKKAKKTPLMEQYYGLKAKHPDAILLFRVGDFYETFGEDAIKTAEILGIVLTSRNNGGNDTELAGFPYHSLNVYLPKLVRAGFRVAICEQLEKPSKEKKIVKRGITDLVTPGVTIDDTILDKKSNNYLASLHVEGKDYYGLAFLDISTGEFLVSEGHTHTIEKLLHSYSPTEVIYDKSRKKQVEKLLGNSFYAYSLDEWIYTKEYTDEKLFDQFKVKSLKGYGIEHLEAGRIAAGAGLHYLASTQNEKIKHIANISRIQSEDYVWLDRFTIKNLELVNTVHDTGISLFSVLDKTISPMGARLLKKWVLMPLLNPKKINQRFDIVQVFMDKVDFRETIAAQLKKIGDLERLVSKLAMEKISPREVTQLHTALEAIGPIKKHFENAENESLQSIGERLYSCQKVKDVIHLAIHDEAPAVMSKGQVIKDGYNEELDELNNLVRNSKEILIEIQTQEAIKTGITNLKIGFNNVFGYYLEVTNKYKNQGLIPDNWIRKQTLTGSERYVTEELKLLESKILTAQDKIYELEAQLYQEVLIQLSEYLLEIQHNATLVAQIDCLRSLAEVALKNNYCRPQIDNSFAIDIIQGRHPVIEQQLALDDHYVPNDVFLDDIETQIMMITGPNMSGKSALLRQTALIVLMAQMGSFVPAQSAQLGVIDKVFTRVGASDNISSGESTFMLEMNETASIMNNVSPRSLILLDEIGRGTSTYDGISIAWSLAEFLHNNSEARPKTLFATHYHELNELATKYPRIKNYNIATREVKNKVIFLRKLEEGGCEHSFGIHVAQMAGMPNKIIIRAQEILHELEQKSIDSSPSDKSGVSEKLSGLSSQPAIQMSIFETHDPTWGKIRSILDDININKMTPIECMMKLKELLEISDDQE